MLALPNFNDVLAAAQRIAPFVHSTPVLQCASLDAMCGARVHLKAEHLQRVGAFKLRGASNAIQALDVSQAERGVITHSSGNHGQALAHAARTRGIDCTVVMPENSVQTKIEAVRDFGARVVFCAANQAAREATVAELIEQTGALMVHPYENPWVIAGQGTAALELLQDHPTLQTLIAPVGGGGLISGMAIVASAQPRPVKVFAVEPENGCEAFDSMRLGVRQSGHQPQTICDGLRAGIGEINFTLMQSSSVEVLLVSDAEVIEAMRWYWERSKQLIEPSSATVIAALKRHRHRFSGTTIGAILTGGNVDLDRLPWQG